MRRNTFEKQVRVRTSDGSVPHQQDYPVAASQTIKLGDIVAISSGTVAQAIALPGSNSTETSAGSVTLLGVAMADITTTGTVDEQADRIPVAIFDDTLEVALKIRTTVASDSEPQDLVFGTAYQLGRWRGASANVWWYFCDVGTTNAEMRYMGRANYDGNDEDYGQGWFKPIATYRAIT